jgi:hypothetical protein
MLFITGRCGELSIQDAQPFVAIPPKIWAMTTPRRAPRLRIRCAPVKVQSRLYDLCRVGQLRKMAGLRTIFEDAQNCECTLESGDFCIGGLVLRPSADDTGTAYILVSYTHTGFRGQGLQRLLVNVIEHGVQPSRIVRQADDSPGNITVGINERLGFEATKSAEDFVLSAAARAAQPPMLKCAHDPSDSGSCVAMEKLLPLRLPLRQQL